MLSFFFFNDTATTEIYTLSLHDALPIYLGEDVLALDGLAVDLRLELRVAQEDLGVAEDAVGSGRREAASLDRKSTRLNSSHLVISYAVFCLKKKTKSIASPRPTATSTRS